MVFRGVRRFLSENNPYTGVYTIAEAKEKIENINKRINDNEKKLSILTEKLKEDPDNGELVQQFNDLDLNAKIEKDRTELKRMVQYRRPVSEKLGLNKIMMRLNPSGGRKTKKKTNKKKTNKKKTNKKKTNKRKQTKRKNNN